MEKTYTKKKKVCNPQKQFKDGLSCMGKEDGYMTLLACMLFLAISTLLFICLDGSLVYQAKARAGMAQTGLTEHLLANYDVPLARRYHLYFLDPRVNAQILKGKGEEYYKELMNGSSSSGLFGSSVWRMQQEYIEVMPYGTMQEKEFQYFLTQIEDDMKHDLTKETLMEALGLTIQETEKQASIIEETLKDLDESNQDRTGSSDSDDNTLTPSEVAEGETAGTQIRDQNPLQIIREILKYGVLEVVTDESKLSERKIAPSLLPFKNQQENKIVLSADIIKNIDKISSLLNEQNIGGMLNSAAKQGSLNLYIQKYFNYYGRTSPVKDTQLLYELEYILGGQYSDKENLEYVAGRLILLRFALNAPYAFGNEQLRSQALSFAAILTGATGTPEFVEAVRYIILAAVNLIESVRDVKALFEGAKVPIMKTSDNWQTLINGGKNEGKRNQKKGLTYQDYTLLLLSFQSDLEGKCYRMQNLMQINIQQEEPEFLIRECRAGISLSTGVKVKPVFYLKEYLLKNERRAEY